MATQKEKDDLDACYAAYEEDSWTGAIKKAEELGYSSWKWCDGCDCKTIEIAGLCAACWLPVLQGPIE